MKLSAFCLAALGAFAASMAQAAPPANVKILSQRFVGSFNGSCGQMTFIKGDSGHAEYVTSTEVSYDANSKTWRVAHHMSSGQTYWRKSEYIIHNSDKPNVTGWWGQRINSPKIGMTGQLLVDDGHVWYGEGVFRLDNHGNPGDLISKTLQDCGPLPSSNPVIASAPASPAPSSSPSSDTVPLIIMDNGRAMALTVFVGGMAHTFLLDTGATDVSVPADLADALIARGEAVEGPKSTSVIADGSEHVERTIIISSMKVGSHYLGNVRAGVAPNGAMSLLGMSVLNRIGKFSVDAANGVLTFI
jgi:clan AA aspartic protease (TIGR02281 family)